MPPSSTYFFVPMLGLLFALNAAVHASEQEEAALPATPPGTRWKLVWSDEFEGKTLETAKWNIIEGKRRDAWWSARAIELRDGKLVIKTFEEKGKYYDACITTEGKFEHAFGYYIARIKLQKQPGHWSAFWLHTDLVNRVGNDGRDGTEIDIMEKPWIDDRVQHTLHWDGYSKQHHRSTGHISKHPGIMEGWHTYGLQWLPDRYVFDVNGKPVWTTKDGGVSQVRQHIRLSDELEYQGWAGKIADAKLPDEFEVDYVRVYDLVDEQGKPVHPVPAAEDAGAPGGPAATAPVAAPAETR